MDLSPYRLKGAIPREPLTRIIHVGWDKVA